MTSISGDYFLAILVFFATLIIAGVVQVVLKVVKRGIRNRTDVAETDPKYHVLNAIDGPAVLILLIGGFTASAWLAVAHWQTGQDIQADLPGITWRVGLSAVVGVSAYLGSRISRLLLDWYLEYVASKTSTQLDDQLIPSFKRMMPILLYSLAALWVLSIFDIAISPLLATLGIGGIAIALAAQPTLSNYFAGTYVISEGEIEPGDFIEIEGGPSGFVEDISWRSTKLRSRFNNLIIIPNSMMSENMITNYSRPALAMNVIASGGVSYSADLQQVEDILMDIATQLVVESEFAVTETEPRAGFSAFGDSNIDFWVFLQATDRAGSFTLKTQLIKEIHSRFNEAGIVINYPIRHLVVDEKPADDDGDDEDDDATTPEQIVQLLRDA